MGDNEKEKDRSTQLAPVQVREFLDNQRRELEIRAGELQLKSQEDSHAFEHAGKALEAQERDRKDERQFKLKAAKHRYWFVGALVLVSILFILSLVYMGKDQMATEIVKAAVYLASGAIGGFFYGRGKRDNHFSGRGDQAESESED